MPGAVRQRWRRRPLLAVLTRAAIFLGPVVVAFCLCLLVGAWLPAPHDGVDMVLTAGALLVVAGVTVVGLEHFTSRFLPLAWLLELCLLFPGTTPSRFRVALRAGSTRRLQRVLSETDDEDREPVRAAEQVLTLTAAISAHDRKTRGHSERVRAYAELLADELGVHGEDLDRLRWAALLHDVGKITVPGAILNKDGKPNAREWDVLREHPAEGARLAGPLLPWLGRWGEAIGDHHERFDGSGYPRGLSGDAIAYGARIVGVADAFETMTSPRSYKAPLSADDARRELARCAGSQFDPDVVRAFLHLSTAKLQRVAGATAWAASLPIVRSAWALTRPAVGHAAMVLGVAAVTSSVAGPGIPDAEARTVMSPHDRVEVAATARSRSTRTVTSRPRADATAIAEHLRDRHAVERRVQPSGRQIQAQTGHPDPTAAMGAAARPQQHRAERSDRPSRDADDAVRANARDSTPPTVDGRSPGSHAKANGHVKAKGKGHAKHKGRGHAKHGL